MLLSLYLGTSMWRLFSESEEHTAVPLQSLHLSNTSFLYCPTHCNATFAAMKGCGFVNSGKWGHCGQPQNVTRINALLKRDLVCLILKDLDVVFKLEGAVIVPASKMKENLIHCHFSQLRELERTELCCQGMCCAMTKTLLHASTSISFMNLPILPQFSTFASLFCCTT